MFLAIVFRAVDMTLTFISLLPSQLISTTILNCGSSKFFKNALTALVQHNIYDQVFLCSFVCIIGNLYVQ
jgi:hypothetical protein